MGTKSKTMFWCILLLILKGLWLLNVNLRFPNQSSILRSSHGLQPEVWVVNPDALRGKLKRELLSGFGCDINRKLLQLVKTSGSCSVFATESVQLCTFLTTWLHVPNIGKHKNPDCTEGFSLVSTGFRQSLVQRLCALWLTRPKPSLSLGSFLDSWNEASWSFCLVCLLVCVVPLLATCVWHVQPFLPSFTETYRSVKALNCWLLLPCVLFTDAG